MQLFAPDANTHMRLGSKLSNKSSDSSRARASYFLRDDGGFEIGHFDVQNLLLKGQSEMRITSLDAPPINEHQYGFVSRQSST